MSKNIFDLKPKALAKPGPFGDIIDAISPNSVEFKHNGFYLGDSWQQMYTVYNYPPSVKLEWLLTMSRLSNAFVTFHVEKANKAELLENIDRTISNENVKKLEATSVTSVDESDIIIERARELARKIKADDGKAINLTTTIGVFGKNKEEVDKNYGIILGKLEGEEFSLRSMTHEQKEGFEQQLPACLNKYKNRAGIDMSIDTWSAGLGIFTNQSLSHNTGSYLGKDKGGEPTFWNIWNRDKENQANSNLVITGTSGAGKSTVTKKMLLAQFARGNSVVILDAEREYLGMAGLFGGNIIETSGMETKSNKGGETTIVNPLQIRDFPEAWDEYDSKESLQTYLNNRPDGQYQGPLSIHISFLKTWFPLYIPELTSRHMTILEKCLYETYRRKGITERSDPRFMSPEDFPIMSDLMQVLLDAVEFKNINGSEVHEDSIIFYKELIDYLFSCTEGSDKYIFNGHTNINMDSPFTVFDVHKLLDAPENIKNAQFCNITTFCWMRMTRDRSEPCILIVDEAHLFISKKHNQVFEWLSSSSRRFRKYYASLWLATQNISDFLQENIKEFGEPLLNNPDLKLVMKQRSTDLDKLENLFNLSKTELELIEKAGRGEGMLMIGTKKHIFVNIEVSPKMLKMIEETGGGK